MPCGKRTRRWHPHSCLAVIYLHRTIKPTQLPPIFLFLSLCQPPSEPRFEFQIFSKLYLYIYCCSSLYSYFPVRNIRRNNLSWEASKGLIPWSDGWEWRWTRDLRTGARRRNGGTARSLRSPFARRRRRKKRLVEGYGTHRRTGISNRLILTLCSLCLLPRRQVWD